MAVKKTTPAMGYKTTRLDALERVEVTSLAEWRAWLKKHHTRTEGIWLITYKKAVPEKHLSWDGIVEEALCFGWIDSTARTVDEERKMHYVCPRKPQSMWSKVNKDRIDALVRSKRMTAAGIKAIERAKQNGSWNHIDAAEALEVPADLLRALKKDRAALRHFEAFPPSARKFILTWIGSAKTEVTRAKRIAETVTKAAQNIRVGSPVVRTKG